MYIKNNNEKIRNNLLTKNINFTIVVTIEVINKKDVKSLQMKKNPK